MRRDPRGAGRSVDRGKYRPGYGAAKMHFGRPTPWLRAEGNNRGAAQREALRNPARSKTLACTDALCTGTGRSRVRPREEAWAASGSLRTEADDERTREVGQTHSTGEVCEPSAKTGAGGDGGKGSGQEQPAPAKHVPNAGSGRCA